MKQSLLVKDVIGILFLPAYGAVEPILECKLRVG
jgi:hypothetical protein